MRTKIAIKSEEMTPFGGILGYMVRLMLSIT